MIAKDAEHSHILLESCEIGRGDRIGGEIARSYTHIKICAWLIEQKRWLAITVWTLRYVHELCVRVAAASSEPLVVAVYRRCLILE